MGFAFRKQKPNQYDEVEARFEAERKRTELIKAQLKESQRRLQELLDDIQRRQRLHKQ